MKKKMWKISFIETFLFRRIATRRYSFNLLNLSDFLYVQGLYDLFLAITPDPVELV